MCSGSCDFFKFWEITDNILETVRGRDIVAMENSQEILCGPSDGTITKTLSDLKGYFSSWKPF